MNSILIDGTAKPSEQHAAQFTELPTNKQAHDLLVLGADVQSGNTKVATKQTTSATDDLPEKFKGKTAREIAQAHAELEKKLGSQGQEIGQLRALADKLLELKRTEDLNNNAGAAKKPVQLESDALLRDPRGSIEQVAKETTAELEQQVAAMRMAMIEQQFTARHPTFRDDMTNTDFQEYVRKSPYRQNLAIKAQNGDVGAADELFSGWEEVKAGTKAADSKPDATTEAKEQARQKALKDASMVSGGSGSADVAQATKPIYSRQALIKKRMDDPSGYYDEAFQAIIMDAYREGRVK